MLKQNILTLLLLVSTSALFSQTETVKISQDGFGKKHELRVFVNGEMLSINPTGELIYEATMEVTKPIYGMVLNKNNMYSGFYIEPGATEVVVSKKGFPSSLSVEGSKSHEIYSSVAHPKNDKAFYENVMKYIESPIALEVFNSKFKFKKLEVEKLQSVYNVTSDKNKVLLKDLKGYLNTVDMAKAEVGGQIIDFEALDEKEIKYSTKEYRGNYVLLDFAATGCGPCWAGYPDMIKETSAYENLQVITYNEDDAIDTWKGIAAKRNINLEWPVLWKGQNKEEVFELYKVEGWPLHYLISPDREILESWFGSGGNTLKQTLERHIKK